MSRLLEVAIAAHPATWRERYAEAVRGTLLDVADDAGGRIPVSETLPLALRGLWMRARRSVAFWGGLVVIAILVASALTTPLFFFEQSTTWYAIVLNDGLQFALLVLGLLGAWAGARSRREGITGAAPRLRRFAVDLLPALAATAVGYVAAFVVLCLRFGLPFAAWSTLLVVLAQAAVVLAAIAIGQMSGAVLPRAIAVFVAPAAVAIFLIQLFSRQSPLMVSRWDFYSGIAYEVNASPAIRVTITCMVVLAVALLAAALRPLWLRIVPVLAIAAVAAAVWFFAPQYIAEPAYVPRAESELICSDEEPVLCLWPEQDAAYGDRVRAQMADAYATAVDLGLPVDDAAPRSVVRYGLTGISVQEGVSGDLNPADAGMGMSGLGPDNLVNAYAWSMLFGRWTGAGGDDESKQLIYSIAILLGGSVDTNGPETTMPDFGIRLLEPAVVPDEDEARAIVERWLSEGVNGVTAPS